MALDFPPQKLIPVIMLACDIVLFFLGFHHVRSALYNGGNIRDGVFMSGNSDRTGITETAHTEHRRGQVSNVTFIQ